MLETRVETRTLESGRLPSRMSLYGVNDEDDEYDIVVGWDPPLQTYFARVEPPVTQNLKMSTELM